MTNPHHDSHQHCRDNENYPWALNEYVTLSFNRCHLQNIITLLIAKTGLNIVFNPKDVDIVITFHLERVRLGAALEAILKTHDLTYLAHENIVRIIPESKSPAEREKHKASQVIAEPATFSGPTSDFKFDVFISHSSADKVRVYRLAERLRSAGLRVWVDDWEIPLGGDILLCIESGLEHSRIQLLCLSREAIDSEWVKLESNTTPFRDPKNTTRRFIPVLLSDCELPATMKRYRYLDFREETEASFIKLLTACQSG